MKKGIYIAIITTFTVICIVLGLYINLGRITDFASDTTSEVQILDSFGKIVIDTDVVSLKLVRGDSFGYSVKSTAKLMPKVTVEDGTLMISQSYHKTISFGSQECKLTVTVPADAVIESADIYSDVGNVDVTSVQITNLKIGTDVGDIDIDGTDFDSLEISSDVGNVKLSGIVNIEEYSVNISADVGNLKYLGQSYKGSFNQSRSGTAGQITIATDVGNIKIE